MTGIEVKIEEEDRGNHAIVRIAGTLATGDTTRALQERLDKIAQEKTGAVVLDLSHLDHLDSTAIGVFVGNLKRFESQGRRFLLVQPRDRVASVLKITHLDSLFGIFPSVDAAFKALKESSAEEETSER
ncbi:MAG: STAS domain-containing protein [Thermoanaerobaculia bacterium]